MMQPSKPMTQSNSSESSNSRSVWICEYAGLGSCIGFPVLSSNCIGRTIDHDFTTRGKLAFLFATEATVKVRFSRALTGRIYGARGRLFQNGLDRFQQGGGSERFAKRAV